MVGIVWQANIVDLEGNVIPVANIEVREQITGTLVALFGDYDLTAPLTNPTQSDGFGFVRLFVADRGLYRITASKGTFNRQWTHVFFGDPFISGMPAGISTPAVLAAGNNNNWNAGLSSVIGRVRTRGDAGGSVLTGMDATGVADGYRVVLTNIDANPITVLHESGLSLAANRFNTNGDLFWPSGVSHEFIRDAALSRWSKLGN